MSWTDTLDSLTGYSGVTCGCIAGHDGAVWAASPDFQMTPEEIKKIVDSAKKGLHEGVTACGKPMRTIRSGDNSLSAVGSDCAVDVAVTNSAVVIAANKAPANSPGVNRLLCVASGNTASHLSKNGY